MDLGLNGKTALITGSTAGIGKATARLLAAEGARVIVNSRNESSVNQTIDELRPLGTVRGVAADASTPDGAETLLREARDIAPVDILVNNAGIFEPKPFDQISDNEWKKFFDVNIMSGVRLSRALAGHMRDRGWGRIVFISSESGINTPPEMIHYGMTKTAQLALARGLARWLTGTGVTVNSVLPGPTWTEGVANFVQQMAQQEDASVDEIKSRFVPRHRPTSIAGRFADPDEVAALVAYVCSERSSITTGAALKAEGGIVNSCF